MHACTLKYYGKEQTLLQKQKNDEQRAKRDPIRSRLLRRGEERPYKEGDKTWRLVRTLRAGEESSELLDESKDKNSSVLDE